MYFKAIAALFSIAIMVGALQAQSIGIGTANPGSIYHSSGTALAKIANEKAGISATVQPFASPNVFIPAINTGELQFGFGSVIDGTWAYEGKEYYTGRPNKNLRAIGITYPIRNAVFVRKNSAIQKISDLKGHAIPDGFTGQKVFMNITDAVLATAGLTRTDIKPVNVPNVVTSADAFAAGKSDMFIFSVGGAKVREIDASVGVRCISVENTPATVAAARKYLPGAYMRLVNPGPDSPGVLAPSYVVTYDGLLFVSSKVSDDIAYKMTKLMYENKAELASTFPLFELFEPKDMVKDIGVPYHPGAIKFYKEKGMWPAK